MRAPVSALFSFLLVVAIAVPCAVAETPTFTIIDRDSVYYGKTYAEWIVAWNQWSIGMPVSQHPLFDVVDCSSGQTGPVWFLGGKYCALNSSNCGVTGVTRSCTVPKGKSLFLSILDTEVSTLETGIASIVDLKKAAQDYVDPTEATLFIDGVEVPNVKDRFRVQTDPFSFTIPKDNQFTAVGEGHFNKGTYFPGVDDGVYVMIAPLSIGQHTIAFTGRFPQWDFGFDVTYTITVTP